MDIDKVFIINLKHRVDRKEKVIKELNRAGIKNYEFFDGIQPKTQEELDNWNTNFLKEKAKWMRAPFLEAHNLKKKDYYFKYKLGALGCLLSHFEIIKISLERKYNKILILEDDIKIIFNPKICSFSKIISLIQKQNNKIFRKKNNDLIMGQDSADILYLGGTHRRGFLNKATTNIYRTTKTATTHAYVISSDAMNYINKNLKNYNKEIDTFYIERIQSKGNCFCIIPPIVTQEDGYSDIIQQKVKYDLDKIY